jgi:hypothetical protein
MAFLATSRSRFLVQSYTARTSLVQVYIRSFPTKSTQKSLYTTRRLDWGGWGLGSTPWNRVKLGEKTAQTRFTNKVGVLVIFAGVVQFRDYIWAVVEKESCQISSVAKIPRNHANQIDPG